MLFVVSAANVCIIFYKMLCYLLFLRQMYVLFFIIQTFCRFLLKIFHFDSHILAVGSHWRVFLEYGYLYAFDGREVGEQTF